MTAWARAVAIALASLALAVLVGVVGAIWLLHEPPRSVLTIAGYLLASGGAALVVGMAGVLFGMRVLPRLSLKVGLAYAIASLGAIITILFTPLLMFKEVQDLHLLALLLVCFLVISLGLAAVIGVTVAGQVNELGDAARRIAGGDFGTRVPVTARDELGELGEAFNRMSEQLGQAFARERAMEQGRRDLIAAISHDLRTPLATMRAMLEAIQDGVVQDEPTIERYHAAIHHEIDRLERLIDDLFELSRLESGALHLDRIPVDLHELLSETLGSLTPQAESQGLILSLENPGELGVVPVDPLQLQRVVVNLVQNAMRHTPPGGEISVRARVSDGEVTVQVADSGEGIAPDDLPHVFDRFYRGEKSRARHTGGAGLGLAISKAIVEAHRGRIWAESEPQRGARVFFTLPRG